MNAEGPARHFHQELDALRSLLLEMSGVAEDQVARAYDAMLGGDAARADEVIELDLRVDELELQIDKAAHELLALQQPMAGDLRLITMTMRIANDLERVGDHAVNVAREVRRSSPSPAPPRWARWRASRAGCSRMCSIPSSAPMS